MTADIVARPARHGRLLVSCAVLGLSACVEHPIKEQGYELPPGDSTFEIAHGRGVDMLFVIDNSGSMAEEQHALGSAFGTLIDALDEAEVGYRIGFTTTDNGNPWCGHTSPEGGALQLSSCRSRPEDFEPLEGNPEVPLVHACEELCPESLVDIEIQPTAIAGDDELRARDWIESSNGLTNLPEGVSTTQALQCFAPQGIAGCGFESPLESMWKAVRRTQTEDDPAYGFLREDAVLSIVHVTDEMDCSYNSDWETIFLPDGSRALWSDPDAAAPTSAVCWNAGVACEGEGPYDCHAVDRYPDGSLVPEGFEDERAVLHPVSRYVDVLRDVEHGKQGLSLDHAVLVSVIGGVASDGSVTYQDAIDSAFQQDFGIGPGCEGAGGSAVPPVRLQELAEAFRVGDGQSSFSICNDDYGPTLAAIAEGITDLLPSSCMPACVADADPSTDTLDPLCSFVQATPNDDGTFEEQEVPPCDAGDEIPDGHDVCFVTLLGDERGDSCTDAGFNLELQFVRREGMPVPEGVRIDGTCRLSDDKRADCPDLP